LDAFFVGLLEAVHQGLLKVIALDSIHQFIKEMLDQNRMATLLIWNLPDELGLLLLKEFNNLFY